MTYKFHRKCRKNSKIVVERLYTAVYRFFLGHRCKMANLTMRNFNNISVVELIELFVLVEAYKVFYRKSVYAKSTIQCSLRGTFPMEILD